MEGELYQVDTGYYCAGIVVRDGVVVEAAPVLRWALGKSLDVVSRWVNGKGAKIVLLEETMVDPVPRLVRLVISGGQTGADVGGLVGARAQGVATGGSAPAGWRTETGPAPWLADYGLTIGPGGYAERTMANVEAADATVIFGIDSAGSALTARHAAQQNKPYLWIRWDVLKGPPPIDRVAPQVLAFLVQHQPAILNIAGNRESVWPGIHDYVRDVIIALPANPL